MRTTFVSMLVLLGCGTLLGCEESATEDQIAKMCENLADLRGELRGSDVEAEVGKIQAEWDVKEQALKEDLAKDLKGQDDVLALKIKDIEAGNGEPLPEVDTDSDGEPEEQELTPEEVKAKQKELAEALIAKRKAEVEKGYAGDFEKLPRRRDREIGEAREAAEKKRAKADKTIADCVAQYQKEGLSKEAAQCRIDAKSESWWRKKCK